jgi:nicotinamidase-related amidase
MPLSQLDPTPALISIDLQKGIVTMPTVHPASEIVARTAQIARAFRARMYPVVLVNVAGMSPGRSEAPRPKLNFPPDWTDLAPELDAQPTDHLVTKHRIGAFIGTDLDQYLRQRKVTQVFLAGIATTFGVESTARSAHDLGYNVVFVTDAMTDRDPDAHRNAVEKLFPRFGETTSTAELLSRLK